MSEKGPATGSALPQGCGFFLGLTQHPDRYVNLGLLRKSFFYRASHAPSRNHTYPRITR